MIALVSLFALMRGYEWMFVPSVEVSSSRQLLSGGGEVIPGFSGACDKMSSWENDSGAVLHVIFVIYLFLGIAVICDEQFTSSLESICNSRTGLGLSPDVAGATFMAAGSSAPELASSFMGTFVSKSDVGLGTIIGSAVFNILIIIGATAIVVGEPMQLDWKPLGRDVCFYCGSVVVLIAFVAIDNKIDWYEALILLLYYGLYILWMVYNTSLMRKIAACVGATEPKIKAKSRRPSYSTGIWHSKRHDSDKYTPDEGGSSAAPAASAAPAEGSGSGSGLPILPGTPLPSDTGAHCIEMGTQPSAGTGSGNGADELPGAPTPTMGDEKAAPDETAKAPAPAPAPAPEPEKKEEEEEEEPGMGELICEYLSIPYALAYDWTMPDCKYEDPSDEDADEAIEALKEEMGDADSGRAEEIRAEIASLERQKELRGQLEEAEEAEDDEKTAAIEKELFALYEPLTQNQKLYLVTFFVSLIWITILSYFMVTLMEKIGCAWGISSFIMGITFLAMGTSVPDALGSISVAKEGEGDMAVSNAIGSNVFDICIGLGFPWFLATLIDGEGRTIKAATESIIASATILFLVVVVLFTALYCSKHPETKKPFCLYPMVGYILFASYFSFVVFQISWTAAGLPE